MCFSKKKKRKTKEKEEEGLAKPKFKRSASQANLVRSNSFVGLDQLTISARKIVSTGDTDLVEKKQKKRRVSEEDDKLNDGGLAEAKPVDYSVIGVFSRENSKQHGKEWFRKMLPDKDSHATESSKKRVKKAEHDTLLNRQARTEVTTGFGDQVNELFKDKWIPHVIVVLEGETEDGSISLSTKVKNEDIDLSYTRSDFYQGKINNGSRNEHRRDMTVYIRDDMKGVYTVTLEEIPVGKGVQQAFGINYQTEDGTNEDGTNYRTLVVHMKNEFADSDNDVETTHQAFEDYAKKALEGDNPVVVTGYIGDTNYNKPKYPNSVASMGGHSLAGETLNPEGSGSENETNFMQHIPLGKESGKHSVRQPSTLNYVFPDTNPSVDHPSIAGYTAHSSRIRGRDSKFNSRYYEIELGEVT
jgi:hypothetical protein